MFRLTAELLVKSHQLKKAQHPNAGTRLGRNYTRGFVKYGFLGFGMSTYTPRKNRAPKIQRQAPPPAIAKSFHLSQTTKSLSPHFRSFALADGGVLFAHPSHKQIMQWGQDTLTKEAEATGMTSMDQFVQSRIQAIIADNTLENVSLSHWRKKHMWTLLKSRGKIQKRWAPSGAFNGMRTTLHGKADFV